MSAQMEAAAARLLRARHGERAGVVQEFATQWACTPATVYARLKPFLPAKGRKRRSDAGACTLSRAEARKIAAYVEYTRADTGCRAALLDDVVRVLRKSGEILAGRIDESTGEFAPLSTSAIRRALAQYHYHPRQLAADAPTARLYSPHPNYCWQNDATVSGQYYLADDGLRVLVQRQFNAGKPGNMARINDRRLWAYNTVDHCTHAIDITYVQGAESAANMLTSLICAMTERDDSTFFGVPKLLMVDPGAGASQAVRTFCAALGIRLLVHAAGEAQVNGSVEVSHDIGHRRFEAHLRMLPPVCRIEDINQEARLWCRDFNATRQHSRHGMTRRDAWLHVTSEQLARAPAVDVLRQLANSAPKECTVRDWMIRFRGRVYDLRELPGGALNGAKVSVVRNALDADEASVRVLTADAEGQPMHFLAPEITRRAFGFLSTAALIGEEYKAAPDTPADAARKELDRVALDARTDAEAKAARKAKKLPFGGRVDPRPLWRESDAPAALPRAGRALNVQAPDIIQPTPAIPAIRPQYAPVPLTHAEMARGLKRRVEERGGAWNADLYARMAATWPDGVPDEQLDDCAIALMRGGLRTVGGSAA